MNSGKILLGVLAGVAAGALLGVLLAPEKGSDTRKNISKKGDDYADDLKGKLNNFLEDITEKFEVVKDKANELMENGIAKTAKLKVS